MAQVEILFTRDGTPTIKVNGLKGPSCKDATRAVERALGKVTSDKPTVELVAVEVHNHAKHNN